MFKSKYIFETRRTRIIRYIQNTLFLFFIGLVGYSIFCFLFILVSQDENKITNNTLFNRPPDIIVVFTGDKGRIPYALKMAKNFKQPNVFITGVYSKNTVQSLLKEITIGDEIDPNLLKIDYLARNTVENVLSTLRYLRKQENTAVKKVLIVSHDYHIMRIKLIVNTLKNNSDNFDFYYTGFESNYKSLRSIKVLYKEVFKFFRTFAFLALWSPS